MPRPPHTNYLLFLPFDFFLPPDFLAFPPPPAPILNIFVPQTPHVPVSAFLPFFMVTARSPFISLFALHFTQYPVVPNSRRSHALRYKISSTGANFAMFECQNRTKIGIFWAANRKYLFQGSHSTHFCVEKLDPAARVFLKIAVASLRRWFRNRHSLRGKIDSENTFYVTKAQLD